MGGKASTRGDSQKVCQSPQHITHNISSAVSKLPERLRLCSPVTKQLSVPVSKASNWSPRPQLETTSINQVIQGPRVIVEAPSFSCGLKASIQKGRMAERSIKLVRPRVSLVQMHCYLAPKKNSQKCPYKGQNIFEPKTHISKSFSNTFTETCSFLSWIKVGQPHQKYVLWWSSPIRQASAHQWSETWPGSGSAWRCNLATYLWASSINQGMTTMSLAGSPTRTAIPKNRWKVDEKGHTEILQKHYNYTGWFLKRLKSEYKVNHWMSWGPEVSVFWQILLIYSDAVHASLCSTFTLEDTLSFTQNQQSATQESP